MKNRAGVGLLLFLALSAAACSEKRTYPKETYPVTGQVVVDGEPAGSVQVVLHDVKGIDKENPTVSMTFTDDQGRFAVSTYESGDGVPEGEYAVTFMWGELNLFSMQYGGPDKLKGKYNDPKKSTFNIRVEKGKPTDMGRIELSTS